MKKAIPIYLFGSLIFLTWLVLAHEKHQHGAQSIEKTVVGEVIDPVCYLSHDSRGQDHAECAVSCAKEGITLGILEEKTGKVYVSLPVDHSNPNSKLLDYIAQRVEVKGTVFQKGGLTGLFVQSVRVLPRIGIPSANRK